MNHPGISAHRLRTAFRRWLEMPGLLMLIVPLFYFFGATGVIAPLFPGWEKDGREVPVTEVWAAGVAPTVMGMGAAMILFAWLLHRGFPWVRHLVMGLLLLAIIAPLFDTEEPGAPPLAVTAAFISVFALVVLPAAYFYLYRSRKAVRHFTGSPSAGAV
ncbi:hypothetical protein OVA24_17125 [Luteolibacter sp. SL250]|uniref:hypothetical protein n=1 Tax=Luteolibacter sp. SL250 TaxID=2995170 RepID=UPI0022715C07|nr:hypothetical protein [Luteolibacter sp. SL250]WAC18956.1 hypothetical protein OVA24_17125 [Luteolibacter sp. SL250]